MHAIRLPSGRLVGARQYVNAWRKLRTLPPETRVPGFDAWGDMSAAECLAEVRRAMHDRINRAGGVNVSERGRDSLAIMRRDARVVTDALHGRIRHAGRNILSSRYLARRYPHVHNPSKD